MSRWARAFICRYMCVREADKILLMKCFYHKSLYAWVCQKMRVCLSVLWMLEHLSNRICMSCIYLHVRVTMSVSICAFIGVYICFGVPSLELQRSRCHLNVNNQCWRCVDISLQCRIHRPCRSCSQSRHVTPLPAVDLHTLQSVLSFCLHSRPPDAPDILLQHGINILKKEAWCYSRLETNQNNADLFAECVRTLAKCAVTDCQTGADEAWPCSQSVRWRV